MPEPSISFKWRGRHALFLSPGRFPLSSSLKRIDNASAKDCKES